MIQGFVPFAFNISITFQTIFLKMSGGVVTIFPPRWKIPSLLKGSAEVPSYCLKRTKLLPSVKTLVLLTILWARPAYCLGWLEGI
jgi:hypothetical protein